MEAVDGIGLAREKLEESSNGSGYGNGSLGVGPDVIDITCTLGFDSPKGDSQSSEHLDHSSPSLASTSIEQAPITNTIISDTIDIDTTSTTPIPTTNIPSQLTIPNPSSISQHNTTTPMTAMGVRTAAPALPSSSLSDLSLHSPSSQMVGTPFASSSMPERFEYPFPDAPMQSGSPPLSASNSSSSTASPQPTIASVSPMMALAAGSNHVLANASIVPPRSMSSPPTSSPASYQYASPHHANSNATAAAYLPSRAAALPYSTASSSSSHVHAQAEAPAGGPAYGSYSTYTPAHPKLRAQASAADPPVPPSLARKRRSGRGV